MKAFLPLLALLGLISLAIAQSATPIPMPQPTQPPQIMPQSVDSEPDELSVVLPLYLACAALLGLIILVLFCSLCCLDHTRYVRQGVGTHHIAESAHAPSLQMSVSSIHSQGSESSIGSNWNLFSSTKTLYNRESKNSALDVIEWQSLCFHVSEGPQGPLKKLIDRIRACRNTDPVQTISPEGKPLLFNVSGYIEAGQIMAVMGESGSGKSLIAGLSDTSTGTMFGKIRVNGEVFDGSLVEHGICAYVAQQTVLSPHLSIREILMMTAKLYQPFESAKELDSKVDDILAFLGLDAIQHRRVTNDPNNRGVSGGQARRINLAEGILSGAKLIILDEPTTGLSATDAKNVFDVLYRLAKDRNFAIMMIIHQPRESLFMRLDKAMIIHQGLNVFTGEPLEVQQWVLRKSGTMALNKEVREMDEKKMKRKAIAKAQRRLAKEQAKLDRAAEKEEEEATDVRKGLHPRRKEGKGRSLRTSTGAPLEKHDIMKRVRQLRNTRDESARQMEYSPRGSASPSPRDSPSVSPRDSPARSPRDSPSDSPLASPLVSPRGQYQDLAEDGDGGDDDLFSSRWSNLSAGSGGLNTAEAVSKLFQSTTSVAALGGTLVHSQLVCSNLAVASLCDDNSYEAYKVKLAQAKEEEEYDEERVEKATAKRRVQGLQLLRIHFSLVRLLLELLVKGRWAWRMLSRYHGALLYALLSGLAYGTLRGIFIIGVGDTVDDVRNRFGAAFITLADSYIWLPWLAFYVHLKPTTLMAMAYGRDGQTAHILVWSTITILRAAASAVATVTPTYWLAGLNPAASAFFQFLLIKFLANCYAMFVALVFAVLVPRLAGATALTSITLLPFFALAGFFVKESLISAPFRWITGIDPIFYQLERGFQAEMGELEFKCGEDSDLICPVDGEVVLASQDFYYRPWTDYGFILLWVLIPLLLFSFLVVLRTCCQRRRTHMFYSRNQMLQIGSEPEYVAALPLQKEGSSARAEQSDSGQGSKEGEKARQQYLDLLGELESRHQKGNIASRLVGRGGFSFFRPATGVSWADLSFSKTSAQSPPSSGLLVRLYGWLPFLQPLLHMMRPGTTQILTDSFGCVKKGQLAVIMGPSGCGKSSLLDALAGSLQGAKKFKGAIYADGKSVTSRSLLDTRLVSYITQEELIWPEFTVAEAMAYASTLQLPPSVSHKERKEMVDLLLRVMNLDSVRDNVVGGPVEYGISGGQLRRLAIATEGLLTGARTILLDEPTSGLSGDDSMELVLLLRGLCDRFDYTIITTIHQPAAELMDHFDQMLIMSKGHTVYAGPPSGLVGHFANYGAPLDTSINPLDSLIDVVTKEEQKHAPQHGSPTEGLYAFYEESASRADLKNSVADVASSVEGKASRLTKIKKEVGVMAGSWKPGNAVYAAPFAKQFLVLFGAFGRGVKRNPRLFRMFIMQAIVLSVFFGGAYFQIPLEAENIMQLMGGSYLVFTVFTFIAGNHAVTLHERIPILTYELQRRYYRILPEVIVIVCWNWLKIAIGGIIFANVTWWMIGLRDSWWYMLEFTAAFIATGWFCDSLTFFLMFLVSNEIVVAVLLGIITSSMHLVAGFFIDLNSIIAPLQWTSWVSPMRYGAELIFNAILLDATFRCEGSDVDQTRLLLSPAFGAASPDVDSCPVEGNTILDAYGYDRGIFLRNELVLVAEALFLYIVAMVLIVFHRKSLRSASDLWAFIFRKRSYTGS